jgi:hypothetical protein
MTLIYPIALGRTGMIGKPTSFPILPTIKTNEVHHAS